ncbi:hypothetical protein ACGF7U_08070 [Micromonospora sp. NPDC047670]|uniref:hypothetical protein n=1 Tax=Micromonospora sp. NPDC047670 TaxID=3364252 RepID=UPI003721F95B
MAGVVTETFGPPQQVPPLDLVHRQGCRLTVERRRTGRVAGLLEQVGAHRAFPP